MLVAVRLAGFLHPAGPRNVNNVDWALVTPFFTVLTQMDRPRTLKQLKQKFEALRDGHHLNRYFSAAFQVVGL
jgi:hypothetical protein